MIIRAGYALGGLGSGFAYNEKELVGLVTQALSSSEMVSDRKFSSHFFHSNE